MALDNWDNLAGYTLPAPSDTSYRTPSRGVSARSSKYGSSSPAVSSSPPQLPPVDVSFLRESPDTTNDEKISILDPRRFTPTLHANLVSEILTLRREVESKNGLVVHLEENLHGVKAENDRLNTDLKNGANESRSMKRQMDMLEGGTLSALEDLAKERDGAKASLSEARRRLEVSNKKVRNQEDEQTRLENMWNQDKQNWDNEKRNLDRKVHVVEGRLKTLLSEMATAQSKMRPNADSDINEYRKYGDRIGSRSDSVKRHRQHDSVSTRNGASSRNAGEYASGRISGMGDYTSGRMSAMSGRMSAMSGRISAMSGRYDLGDTKLQGPSLAEELGFDVDSDPPSDEEDAKDGPQSPNALPEESHIRPKQVSRQSFLEQGKARKILGLANVSDEAEGMPLEIEDSESRQPSMAISLPIQGEVNRRYTDTGTQYSPPSSPTLKARPGSQTSLRHGGREPAGTGIGAILNSKQLPATPKSLQQSLINGLMFSNAVDTVSQACQTIDLALNTVSIGCNTIPSPELKVAMTQTDPEPEEVSSREATDEQPTSVPTITIHAPASRPSSSRQKGDVVLPPNTKSTGCQISIDPLVSLRSISVQTEEIRVDRRNIKLPPHLLPAAIPSNPASSGRKVQAVTKAAESGVVGKTKPQLNPRETPPVRTPPASVVSKAIDTANTNPNRNDNGPLKAFGDSNLKRPVRSGSLFAGFDDGPAELSDDDFVHAEPIRKTLSKVKNSWKLVPQGTETGLESDKSDMAKDLVLPYRIPEASPLATPTEEALQPTFAKGVTKSSFAGKQPNIRRAALVASGTQAHVSRPRSPSAPTASESIPEIPELSPPPFPVPTRSSSRKIPISSSDGARSPTPQSTSFFGTHREQREKGRPPTKRPILRKVRSAAAISKPPLRSKVPSPPPMSPRSPILNSSKQSPLPRESALRRPHVAQQLKRERTERGHTRDISNDSEPQSHAAAAETGVQQISVVDAIAQTMVGEWMYKYVRRRKSFGMPESASVDIDGGRNAADNGHNSNVRHKRWVWLAPYERAVMWSTKQPMTGSALLGKNGRKLVIQSVLDVKDDTTMPKNLPPDALFGRSILILTSERALKFTATTRERHYVWLTALSFLSHSTTGVKELATLPPVPVEEYQPPKNQAPTSSLRRNPIRDSIRVAKSKDHPLAGRRRDVSLAKSNAIQQKSNDLIPEIDSPHNEVDEAAEPPHVPRSRNRSSTGPKPVYPPVSFRSFSTTAATAPSVHHSISTASGDMDYPYIGDGNGGNNSRPKWMGGSHGSQSAQNSFTRGRSRPASGSGSGNGTNGSQANTMVTNFFDALGTVRMDAFVGRDRKNRKTSRDRNNSTAQSQQDHSLANGLGARSGNIPPSSALPAGDGAGPLTQLNPLDLTRTKPVRNSYRTREGRKKDLHNYWGVNVGNGSSTGVNGGAGVVPTLMGMGPNAPYENVTVVAGPGGEGKITAKASGRNPFEGF